jgi:hypothetical protein
MVELIQVARCPDHLFQVARGCGGKALVQRSASWSPGSVGQMAIDGGEQFIRRQPGNEAVGAEEPAHDAVAVNEESRGRIDVFMMGAGARMQDLYRFGQILRGVGNDDEMREIGLRGPRGLRIIIGNGEDTNVPAGKFLVTLFELTQLDRADQSPASAKEDQHRGLAAGEILIGEGLAVRQVRGECWE